MNIWNVGPGMLAIIIILVIGTVARLTRLITADSITDPARDWITKKAKDKLSRKVWTKIDDLLSCPWCVSIYVAAATSFIVVWHWSNRFILAGMIALTASWVAANIQVREPE